MSSNQFVLVTVVFLVVVLFILPAIISVIRQALVAVARHARAKTQAGAASQRPATPGTVEVVDFLRRAAGNAGHRHATDVLDQRLADLKREARHIDAINERLAHFHHQPRPSKEK